MISNWDEYVREQESDPESLAALETWRSHFNPAYVPLSVREAPRFSRKRFGWWLKGLREALALRLAPWLISNARHSATDATPDSPSTPRRLATDDALLAGPNKGQEKGNDLDH